MSRGRSAAALVAVFAFFFLISNSPLNIYDEGFVLYAAERIARGEVPYRDFQLHYMPAQFYVVAALFEAVGHSIFVERMWDAAARTLLVAGGFALARTIMPVRPAAAAALLVMLRLGAAGFHGFAMLPALAFALLSGTCLLAAFPDARRGLLIAAGALAGVATLFRQDIGGFAVLTAVLLLGAWRWLGLGERPETTPRGTPSRLLPYALALAAALLPPTLFFVGRVGPSALWHELVVYPRSVVIPELTVPAPGAVPDFRLLFSAPAWRWGHVEREWGPWSDFYVPLAAYLWTAGSLARSLRREGRAALEGRESWALVYLTLMGLALFGYASYRFDPIHAAATFVPAAILVTRGLWRSLTSRRLGAASLAAGLAALALGFLWVGVPLSRWAVGTLKFRPPVCAAPFGRSGCVELEASQREALDFVRRRTAPGEPIFVGAWRHHPIPQNDTSFYFLADRPPATRFHELLSGAATPVAIQEEIIAALKRPAVRYAVLYAGVADPRRPEASGEGSGAPLVDAQIREAFREIARFGPYSILAKR
ncbi:MAG TPA: hypothetical protein VFO18_16110 [Methylomirabilota bacterium]|nr:hypothetical protein [Methylomirabilota bacterium]